MILQINHNGNVIEEEIKEFFKLFSKKSDLICFNKLSQSKRNFSKSPELNPTNLLNESFFNFSSEILYIKVFENEIESIFKLKSTNDVMTTLKYLVALHFEYTTCICSGFTVKDRSGKKLNPEVVLFIKSSLDFKVPTRLVFNKNLKHKSESNKYLVETKTITQSKVFSSILLSVDKMVFTENEIIYCLQSGMKLVMQQEESNLDFSTQLLINKERSVDSFLANKTGNFANFLRKIFINKNYDDVNMTDFKEFATKNFDLVWLFINKVPTFNDPRDDVTSVLIDCCKQIKKSPKNISKGNYLNVSEIKYLDRIELGSLRHLFYGD